MSTPVIIIVMGFFIFWGHYMNGVFERRSIPDVLGLMILGLLIGPILNLVDTSTFGQFGSIFSNLVLLFILFESGTDLKFAEVKNSLRAAATITTIGFLFTWMTLTPLCYFMLEIPILPSLFIGAALGGTSSAVVVGLVKKINVRPKTAATLIMESAETDVFTLAIPLSILGLMTSANVQVNTVLSSFISSIILSLIIGIGGAFLWTFILGRYKDLKNTKFMTPAFLFILYGITEYLHFSGPLTALSFGIALGNLDYFEPKMLERIIPNQDIALKKDEKDFFSEMVFLLRTFFFVYIGLSIKIDDLFWLTWGAGFTGILFLVRIIAVKLVMHRDTPVLDKGVISFMIPKGLGAAVIATLPLQEGHPYGSAIQALCFSIILFSTIYTSILFFLTKRGITIPLYKIIFGKDKNSTVTNDTAM
ncbi:MAG TPA: cation:proton antiporter [Saprospiraceae bacterium]|nr:cation:proton antiporter [Saprospiraceae bacterium]MCC6689576.1 cation:proton antiporter [Saprospiraceae bacterium]HMV22837.1 cation:proton antiporter [Saprospiraceae bacterium]HMX81852.1 cation:proton antiporter [Saprospiraceae bacterium]HMX86435.1 cation:proton antiporter [Saprospiraceae bacterium]